MSTKTWVNAHFSPTGTTKKVAAAIADATGLPVEEIDLCEECAAIALGENDVLCLAAPVYNGKVPKTMLDRISRVKGESTDAVVVAVYGNRAYDDALAEMKAALANQGFQVIAAAAFIGQHSIVPSIAEGRPDENDLKLAAEFGAKAAAKAVSAGASSVDVPGKPELPAKKDGGMVPKANSHCTECGICAQKRPVSAIPIAKPSTTNKDACMSCMRCIAICPEHARALPAPLALGAKAMLKIAAGKRKEPELFL